jgi:hypothetical protein
MITSPEASMVGRRPLRVPVMALAMVALLTGVWAGLLRLGWQVPLLAATLPSAHGPLMVSGFLGTLIGLEGAVALGHWWAYAGPLATALGTVALVTDTPGHPGPILMTLGSLGCVFTNGIIIRRQPALFAVIMGLGALAWLVGNTLWLVGWPIYRVVPWWAGFLMLTIAGERLELSRLLLLTRRTQLAFLVGVDLLLCGLVLGWVAFDVGVRVAGMGMLWLAWWLLSSDLARRQVRQAGLPRFTAICLLSGYGWLGVSGALALGFGGVMAGPHYDAMLHALFLGFVVAMLFGHAPTILPAVLGAPVPFQPRFYSHLGVLHRSLLLRVGGDLAGWWPGRSWGGLLNGVALGLFLANTGYAIWSGADHAPTPEEAA